MQIQTGLDDGSTGGTAANGVLDAGEVKSTQVVCSSLQLVGLGALTEPTQAPGAFHIHARDPAWGVSQGSASGVVMLQHHR